MNLPRPLNNNVLVEIVDPHSAVSRNSESESQKKGRIVDFTVASYHLTASSAIRIEEDKLELLRKTFQSYIDRGVFVYWEEFANEGQGFTHEGKQYAFVAWWRLVGWESPENPNERIELDTNGKSVPEALAEKKIISGEEARKANPSDRDSGTIDNG